MNFGGLNKLVELRARAGGQDAGGEPSHSWVSQGEVWAALEPLNGRELLAAQGVAADVRLRIRIRYRADVTAAWRVVYGARVFDVLYVINTRERNVQLELYCSEGLVHA